MNTEISEAIRLYQIRKYDQAFGLLKKYNKQSEKEALYYLGCMYYYGYGCKQSDKESFQLFEKSRLLGDINATYMLASMYEEGISVEKDLVKAFELYEASYHDGDVRSGIKLAKSYEEGYFYQVNKKMAISMYVDCAKKDDPYALYKIGMFYLEGNGLKKSKEDAFIWLNKALVKGSMDAMNQFRLVGSKSSNDTRTKEMVLSIGKELYQTGRKKESEIYLQIAFQEGILEACYLLVEYYDLELDYAKSFELLQKAANQDDPYAYFLLGEKYLRAEGCSSSYIKAEFMFQKSKSLGYFQAEEKIKLIRGDIYARS